jgi:tRNA-dihydrouridine synthase B
MNADAQPNGRPAAEVDFAAQIAAAYTVDPRLDAIVPGFDAPFFQAGLAGYSDGAMRLVARQHGCPYCVTEALLDRTLLCGGKGRRKEDPDLLAETCGMGDPEANRAAGLDDHPMAGQIMGTDPDEMANGAAMLVDMGYDVIDVNLACPVKKIRRRSRGGHFLQAPGEAMAVLLAVREAVPDTVACTVKLRRAFNDTPEMADAFERIFTYTYDIGYAWATVHARTVEQKYVGASRWPFLRDLVSRYADRLIFGSGDIWQVHDIFLMLESTGVSAVAVARGCIGNPWIFRQARSLMQGDIAREPTITEQREALRTHFDFAATIHGDRKASRMMRKFGIRFSTHHPEGETVRKAFIAAESTGQWHAVLEQYYSVPDTANAGVDP